MDGESKGQIFMGQNVLATPMTGSAPAFRNIEKCSIYEADALFKGENLL